MKTLLLYFPIRSHDLESFSGNKWLCSETNNCISQEAWKLKLPLMNINWVFVEGKEIRKIWAAGGRIPQAPPSRCPGTGAGHIVMLGNFMSYIDCMIV